MKINNRLIILTISTIAFALLLIAMHYIPSHALQKISQLVPLPIFTFIVAIVDGFNPCNVFVLALFLGFLASASNSRGKVLMVGFTFVIMIFILYFLFMAAWLNIFSLIGFINPLRISIASFSIIVGAINCKELFFFKKGISLTISDNNKSLIYQKLRNMRSLFESGSWILLFVAAVAFTLFVAMVELPCTAGFPIVYVGVLSGKYVSQSYHYYLYLLYYNIVFILPAATIVGIFGCTLKTSQINQKQVKWLKFIGGTLLLLLGTVLLAKPALII
ncbi:MAG: hypothetical protein JXR42_02390 [Gammaproteobacteria bacterium]|nr:hypothetical protein [Gammaproteobacteria bacterium]